MKTIALLFLLFPCFIFSQESTKIRIDEKGFNPLGYYCFYNNNKDFIYYNLEKIYLFQDNKIKGSYDFEYNETVKTTYLDEKTNTFYILSGFGKIKELGIINFNSTNPKLETFKLSINVFTNYFCEGDIYLKPLENDKILISSTGGYGIYIGEFDIKSKIINEIYKADIYDKSADNCFRLEYKNEDIIQYVSAQQVSVEGSKKNISFKRHIYTISTKKFEIISEEKITLICDDWALYSTSNKFQNSKSCTYLVYNKNEGSENSTLYFNIQILDKNEVTTKFNFELKNLFNETTVDRIFNLNFIDNNIHILENVKYQKDNSIKYGTLHIIANDKENLEYKMLEGNEREIMFIVQDKYSKEQITDMYNPYFIDKPKYFKYKSSSLMNNNQSGYKTSESEYISMMIVKDNEGFLLRKLIYTF